MLVCTQTHIHTHTLARCVHRLWSKVCVYFGWKWREEDARRGLYIWSPGITTLNDRGVSRRWLVIDGLRAHIVVVV